MDAGDSSEGIIMAGSFYKLNATGSGALSSTNTVPDGMTYALVSVTLKMSVAPTTSENFVITLNSNAGSVYDVVLYSLDLSAGSTTSVVYQPTYPLVLEGGDAIVATYTNTDIGTYGLQVTFQGM